MHWTLRRVYVDLLTRNNSVTNETSTLRVGIRRALRIEEEQLENIEH